MKPRIRILLAPLALALLIAPAQASPRPAPAVPTRRSRSPGSISTAPSVSALAEGSPAGRLDIPFTGSGVNGVEWKLNCVARQAVSGYGTASIVGDGIYRFTHRAQETSPASGPSG